MELEDVHFSTLEKIKTDYKLTKNRQYLRDIILDFPFFQIKDLKEEDLNEIQKKTMTLIKKILVFFSLVYFFKFLIHKKKILNEL